MQQWYDIIAKCAADKCCAQTTKYINMFAVTALHKQCDPGVQLIRGLGWTMQEEKFEKTEQLTEEAKRAAREAHLKSEEALKKQHEAEKLNERAAQDRGKLQADEQKLQELRKAVSPLFLNYLQYTVSTIIS